MKSHHLSASAVRSRRPLASFHHVLVFLALLLLAAAPTLQARPTTAAEARRAVQAWLTLDSRPLGSPLAGAIAGTDLYKDAAGADAFYVVSLSPEGFVIVAADDLVEPIVLFSAHGRYDAATDNPMRRLVGLDLPARVGHVRARQKAAQGKAQPLLLAPAEDRARRKWNRLAQAAPALALDPSASGKTASISDVRIAPLVRSRWSQETAPNGLACYNYYTPPGAAGSATNYPAGCVATAMAQLMRYHAWPASSVGSASFSIDVDNRTMTHKLLGGNGSGGAYPWDAMPLAPDRDITTAQRQAIGAVVHDAGVAVGMMYAADGSGAYVSDAADQLVSVFKFSNAIYGYADNQSIPPATLTRMINPNLDAGLPVMLGILGEGNYGHAVLCDGYGYNTSTPYHHLNMGWAGYDDAWYNLPNIDANTVAFNIVDECIYNIFVNGSGEIVSGRVTDQSGKPIAGAQVEARRASDAYYANPPGGSYTAISGASGIYALTGIPASTQYTITIRKPGLLFYPQTVTTGASLSNRGTTGNLWAVNFSAKSKNSARDWNLYR